MDKKPSGSKDDFLSFLKSELDFITASRDAAAEYLLSEGLNVDEFLAEDLKKIKRLQMKLQSSETKKEMIALDQIRQKAILFVEQLMGTRGFNFPDFVREERLSLQNRNIDSFSDEDIKNTLTQYFFLKYSSESKNDE